MCGAFVKDPTTHTHICELPMAQAFKAGFDAVRDKLRALSAFRDSEQLEQLRQQIEAAASVHARMQAGVH